MGNPWRKGPSINPTVSKSPLILFDRSRACNLIVRITNDPFVPQHRGGATSASIYIGMYSVSLPKIITHNYRRIPIADVPENNNFDISSNEQTSIMYHKP